MDCATVSEHLTALSDGALDRSRAEALRAHLAGCVLCQRELRDVEGAIDLSRQLLAPLPELRPGFATRLNARLAEIDEGQRRPAWGWWRPLFVGALSIGVVLVMASSVGGPKAVLVPLGLQAPPRQVVEKPQLFKEYEIIEHLDELENFETVIQTPLDEEILGQQQGAG